MRCAWNELMVVLPPWLRQEVDRAGKECINELRLRINAPPELCCGNRHIRVGGWVKQEDLNWIINAASKYSPWAAGTTRLGYLSVSGGHRIGLCGSVILRDGKMDAFQSVQSLCIRVAGDYPGISKGAPVNGSVLILGAPGYGKTTLLRDLAREIARTDTVCVVDERGELFPEGFDRGERMDVLSLCPKVQGIGMLLRCMGPAWIAVDEITDPADCDALMDVVGCGVKLLATAHAACTEDLHRRRIYRKLLENGIFDHILVLDRDRQWHRERRNQWG